MKVLVVFCCILIIGPFRAVTTREVTHEDIRDALLSLVHMFRTSEDKLERHEFREKALGEQLKKALAGLDKRHRSLDPLKGAVSRLDERLSAVETILLQRDERDKQQLLKTTEILDTLNTLNSNLLSTAKPPDSAHQNQNQSNKVEAIERSLEDIKTTLKDLKSGSSCRQTGVDESTLTKQMAETEKLLNKYDSKLTEYNNNISRIQTDIVPLGEISLADEAWHSKMSNALENQQKNIQDTQKSLLNVEEALKALTSKTDGNSITNKTLESIQEMNYNLKSAYEKGIMSSTADLSEVKKQNDRILSEMQKNFNEASTTSENMYSGVSKSYEQLKTEVQALSKVEKVMIQTGDNVMDTKRRIEYGIHQILLEVGELIRVQGKDLNSTVNKRFDEIETSIVESQTGALSNLSSKIEQEISQVWRQIGIMYQQLTASNTALDRLQAQTEQYVNGSITTMDSMEGKVGMITSRMSEVDTNLNYLLGRLSLVTQEFNRIKTGLGDALDNIKSSFLSVQAKIKETVGPGPHNIPSAENSGD